MPYANHVYFEETGAGRPVIFIHCPALSHVYWRPIMDRLAPLCRSIAIDVRGHGRSGPRDQPWQFADIAADLAMLTRKLDLKDPVLVGYSAGASIALMAALRDPALYSGIVAVGAFSECCTSSMKLKVGAGLLGVRLGLVPFIGSNVIGTNSIGKAHTKAMLPDARRTSPIALRSFLTETLTCNFTHRLHGVRCPVLLVYGGKDEWMHSYYRILHERLPQARALFFDGADHRVPTRQPALFADAVAEFLAGLGPGPDEGGPGSYRWETDTPLLPAHQHPGAELHQLHP
ncbi:MAG TPA: alpha/beta hydrolase [Symbiobacteriaceae bacterium]|nr:alpha/beta hydrolase [Symbiobacteriaceae bacterium]